MTSADRYSWNGHVDDDDDDIAGEACAMGRAAVAAMQARLRADIAHAPEYDPCPAPRPPRQIHLGAETVARHLARRRPAFTLGLSRAEAEDIARGGC